MPANQRLGSFVSHEHPKPPVAQAFTLIKRPVNARRQARPATLGLSGGTSVNHRRLGYFSDICPDPNRKEW